MKKFVFAAVFTLGIVGVALADEIAVVIQKVENKDGKTTITYVKGGGGGAGKKGGGKKGKADPGDPQTIVVTSSATVHKGAFDMDTKMFKKGDAIEKGLMNEMFSAENLEKKGVNATLTVADDGADKGKVTAIVTKGGGGKKGKGGE